MVWPRPKLRAFRFEHLPDGAIGDLRKALCAGIGDALFEQPGVQLGMVDKAQARLEEAFAHHPDLVLDLTFLPASAGVYAVGSTR